MWTAAYRWLCSGGVLWFTSNFDASVHSALIRCGIDVFASSRTFTHPGDAGWVSHMVKKPSFGVHLANLDPTITHLWGLWSSPAPWKKYCATLEMKSSEVGGLVLMCCPTRSVVTVNYHWYHTGTCLHATMEPDFAIKQLVMVVKMTHYDSVLSAPLPCFHWHKINPGCPLWLHSSPKPSKHSPRYQTVVAGPGTGHVCGGFAFTNILIGY